MFFNYMSRPQNVFLILPRLKSYTIRAPKVKNYPIIKSNSKVISEGIIETEIGSSIWLDHKTVYELKPTPEIAQNYPKKVQNDPKN